MQFLVYRPKASILPTTERIKMLTTLNNLTFDSDTPLTVQRISWSLAFIRFSILTKSVSQSPQRVICPGILFK